MGLVAGIRIFAKRFGSSLQAAQFVPLVTGEMYQKKSKRTQCIPYFFLAPENKTQQINMHLGTPHYQYCSMKMHCFGP
jgi:hypothetical protein